MARHHGRTAAPLPFQVAKRPLAVRLLLRLAPLLMPFPLEVYLRVHFTKVGGQTRDFMRSYTELGRGAGLPVGELARLG
jgi:2-dehydropantoate 2-reductase